MVALNASDFETGAITYSVLLLSWLAACLPFEVFARTGWLHKYRLQPNAFPPSEQLHQKALRMAGFNWAWLAVATVAASPVIETLFPSMPLPPAWQIVGYFGMSFLIDDLCFYCYHRLLHSHSTLYRLFHKPHHVFTAPFAWTSHAVHPVEMMLQSVGAMTGPLLFGFGRQLLWGWLIVRQIQGVLDHTGYELPIDPIGWLPGVGGTKFHDDHHKYFNANYASCFSAIDDLFDTRYGKKKNTAKAT